MPTGEHRKPDFEAQIEAQLHAARETIEAANERANARAGRNLPKAIGIALLLGVIFLASLLVVKELFILVGVGMVGFALYELASALKFAGRDVPRLPLVVLGVLIVPATWFFGAEGLWFGTLIAAAAVALYRLLEVAVRPSTRTGFVAVARDIGAGVFCLAYCGVLAGFAVLLTRSEGGEWWMLALVILTTVIDTGALASGVLFGKHSMAPRISPKKTWEGFIGAGLLGVVAGVLLGVFMLGEEWWVGLLFGALILVSGTIGDLAESLIKRDLGIKDISSILPGHGGFLDRLDSILPSCAVAFALYTLVH